MNLSVMTSHFPAKKDGLSGSCFWMACNASRINVVLFGKTMPKTFCFGQISECFFYRNGSKFCLRSFQQSLSHDPHKSRICK